jgi:hypothetical protein
MQFDRALRRYERALDELQASGLQDKATCLIPFDWLTATMRYLLDRARHKDLAARTLLQQMDDYRRATERRHKGAP